MGELVSVCIPLYNGERYLGECLDSVLAQTWNELEILVCDDGSTDASVPIAEGYAARDNRVRIHRNEKNLGLVGNWNKCLELARGDWIKFVFQDDCLEKDCLEAMLAAAGRRKDVLAVCKREFFIDAGASDELYQPLSIDKLGLEAKDNFLSAGAISNAAAENTGRNFIGEPPVTLFHRSLAASFGPYDSSLAQICDLEFCLRSATVKGLVYIPKTLVRIRLHSGSTTSKNLSSKQYITRHSDPVVFCGKLLYSAAYSSFRLQLSWKNTQRLKKFFAVRVYEAFRAAEEEGQPELFRSIAEKCPQAREFCKPSFATRLVYWLVKLKRKSRA